MATDLAKSSAIVFFCVMAFIDVCFGAVYKVGDSLGWTNETNSIDYYKDWASNKTFYVGDTFYFEYDNKVNDVMEVSREDFHSCNPKVPVNIYESGRDSITMWKPGHFFYICTKVGHCKVGQKVDIRVQQQPPSPGPGSSTSPSQPRSPGSGPAAPDGPPSQPSGPSSSSSPSTPDHQQPSHSSPPAPAPSKNRASSKGGLGLQLALQLLTPLGFLAYYF